jgi:hypothetical protein
MGKYHTKKLFFALGLLAALIVLVLPVCAVNGTMSIAYRGSGGSYLGDTIIFDGHNSFSNTTLIRLTGPDLPAGGVPVYDLNGKTGSGNIIEVNPDGSWKFSWYTGSINGAEKLQTARYYLTAFDLAYPEKTATTSILLKKPEFYVIASPNRASSGDYIQLTGSVEKGSSSVHFDITDTSGKIVHAYDTTVSASGYFNKGFHVDMPNGEYTVTMSSPSVKTISRTSLTIAPRTAVSNTPPANASAPSPAVTSPSLPAPAGTQSSISGMESPQVPSNPDAAMTSSRAPLSFITIIGGILISFGIVIAGAKRRKP